MIEANQKIFHLIDDYCAARLDPVSNSGKSRWISTADSEKKFLKNAICKRIVSFSAARKLARFELGLETYFVTVGFDHVEEPPSLEEVDVHAGMLTAIISELRPIPSVSTARVRNIVDIGYLNDGQYDGHQSFGISSLFPAIRVFKGIDISVEENWKVFFMLCVQECGAGDSWIDEALGSALREICDLSLLNMPYETLCRSIFDSDPGAMFLALYRCMEALYAYSSATKVISALKLETEWTDVASALEDNLGWRPKEDAALSSLMAHVSVDDAENLFDALGEDRPSTEKVPIYVSAGNRIYALRNGLVHYRSSHKKIDYTKIDWNRICETVSYMVRHVYAEVFPI